MTTNDTTLNAADAAQSTPDMQAVQSEPTEMTEAAQVTTPAAPAASTEQTPSTDAPAQPKTAIIDVGGGFRAIFGVGVMDYCMEHGIDFDHAYGVSAGSANLTSFIARQHGRNYKFYTVYAFRKEYASMESFIKNHNYANLEYVYSTLSNHDGEYPVDYEAFEKNPTEFTVIACDAETGEPAYFDKSMVSYDNFDIMKASSAVPLACEPYEIDGRLYYDGGIADPIPVQKAIDDGADKVVLILTRPMDEIRNGRKDQAPARMLDHLFPNAAEALRNRADTYNHELALAKRYAYDGKVLILAPESMYGLNTLSKSFEGMERMYRAGYAAAEQIQDFLAR